MYKIIGADGREYGPINAEQLRQWIAQGRVTPQTRVQTQGSADWQPLSALPEFGSAVSALSAPASRTSGLAITSVILGAIGFCGITALAGLILGIIALVTIGKSQGRLTGKGLAIAGICISTLMLLLIGAAIPIVYSATKKKVQMVQCLAHAQQLNFAVMNYTGANTNRYPPASNWCNAIQTYTDSENFRCPSGDPAKLSHFAFNTNFGGMDMTKITNPWTAVLIFETDGGWNLSGGPELLKARHEGKVIIGFSDGHAEFVNTNRLKQLRWTP